MSNRKSERVKTREELIMQYIAQKGYAESKEIAEALKISYNSAYYTLRNLVKLGLISRIKLGRRVVWTIVDQNIMTNKAKAVKRAICRYVEMQKGNMVCINSRYIRQYMTQYMTPLQLKEFAPGELANYIEYILRMYGVSYTVDVLYREIDGKLWRKKLVFCAERREIERICRED